MNSMLHPHLCSLIGVIWLLAFCANPAAAAVSDAKAISDVEQCRVDAGFGTDGRLLNDPTPTSVEVCNRAFNSHPEDSNVAAYLGRALYRNDLEAASFSFIKRSANAGNRIGQFLLGVAYQYGYGVQDDLGEAIDAYRIAALAEHADAQMNLVWILFDRRREKLDISEAVPWLTKAVGQGHCEALNFQGWMISHGIGQLRNAALATQYYLRAAECGSRLGAFNAALHLLETDSPRGVSLLRQAAEAGLTNAKSLLGEVFMRGRIVPRDDVEAARWLQAAINDRDDRAVRILAEMISLGRAENLPAYEIKRIAVWAREKQESRIDEQLDDKQPWPIVWKPGVELPAWKLAERYIVRTSSSKLRFVENVSAAWKMHNLLEEIGPAAAKEILADSLASTQPTAVQRGGNHFARYSSLVPKALVPPIAKLPNKAIVRETILEEKVITAQEFRKQWKSEICDKMTVFDKLFYTTDDVIHAVLPLLLSSRYEPCIVSTLRLIGARFQYPDKGLSTYVVQQLSSKNDGIRSYAVDAASAIGLRLTSDQITALLHDSSQKVKIRVLEKIPNIAALVPPALLAALINDSDEQICNEAMVIARNADSPEVRNALFLNLKQPKLANSAGETLAVFDTLSIPPTTFKGLLDRRVAGKPDIVAEKILEAADPIKLIDELRSGLHSPTSGVRLATLHFAAELEAFDLRSELEAILTSDSDVEVRAKAANILGNFASRESLRALEDGLKDSSPSVRLHSLTALRMDRGHAYKGALTLRNDPDQAIQTEVAKYLDVSNNRGSVHPSHDINTIGAPETTGLEQKIAAQKSQQSFLSALSVTDKFEHLCGAGARKKGFPQTVAEADTLIGMASDIRIHMQTREKIAVCLTSYYASSVSVESLPWLVQIANDPVSSEFLRFAAVDTLLKHDTKEAAELLMQVWFEGFILAKTCATWLGETKMDKFAPPIVYRVLRPYLQHTDPIIKVYSSGCLPSVPRRNVARILQQFAEDANASIRAAALELVASSDESSIAASMQMLRKALRENESVNLRSALWSTGTTAAIQDARRYNGPLTWPTINFWSEAISQDPVALSLQQLLHAIPRSNGNHDSVAKAAVQMSERLPDAQLNDALIARIAPVLTQAFVEMDFDEPHTFSPLVLRAFCEGDNLRTWRHHFYYNKIFDDAIKVLSTQHTSLNSAALECLARLRTRVIAVPADLAAAMVKLFMNGGQLQQAAALIARVNNSVQYRGQLEKSRWLLAQSEVLVRQGEYAKSLEKVDEIDETLRHVGGFKTLIRARASLIRGWALLKSGHTDARFELASAMRGDWNTNILATSLALPLGIFEPMAAARDAVDYFNLHANSSSELRSAASILLTQLIDDGLENGRVEQALVDADQLASLQNTEDPGLATSSMFGNDRDLMLRHMGQLEGRIRRLASRKDAGRNVNSYDKEFVLAKQDLKSWQSLMLARYPMMVALLRPVALDIQKLKHSLGKDRVLIQYLVLPRRTIALVVSNESISIVPIGIDAMKLKNLVASVRDMLGEDLRAEVVAEPNRGAKIVDSGRPKNISNALTTLSQVLVDPIGKIAGSKKEWVIVPHGVLHSLPFSALSFGREPVLTKHTISVIGRAGQLEFGEGTEEIKKPGSSIKVIALGNPTMPNAQWAPLAGAELEIKSIANILGNENSEIFLGPKARKDVLLNRPLGNSILHFAVHGQAMRGIESRLLLADGFLTAKDAWLLPLNETPLVVLSACETGLGDVLLGNEILSLANAFMFAGARYVVASLWRIPDAETRAFMAMFYTRLRSGELPKVALANTQRAAMARGDSPATWAAFVIYGP
ncbi:CHAT domain-containing protein [Undibacterium sp. Ji83W]|uniref:CHAT domain-containing protein n=1 Tax=Undibacterium sp. Ji83W TaxID=3413043 RepID=UPI003BF299A5